MGVFCSLFDMAPRTKSQSMGISSKTSIRAGVTGVDYNLIEAISNLQSKFEVEGCWLCFVREIAPIFAIV